jgi:citrate synthase
MNNKNYFENEDILTTKMGKAFLTQRVVYRGKDLHHHFKGASWLELFLFGITGKEFSDPELKLLNYFWISTSYPDKSIWPNHITALAGSSRSTPMLAFSAGLAACEASIYAGKPVKLSIDFFLRLGKSVKDDAQLKTFFELELKKHKIIYGYGRPLAGTDERVPHVLAYAQELGLTKGKHLKLAIELAKLMFESKKLSMNVVAIYASIAADLGFTAEQFHTFMTPAAFAGMPPCYIEAKENPEGCFLPIRCDRILYVGRKIRAWSS